MKVILHRQNSLACPALLLDVSVGYWQMWWMNQEWLELRWAMHIRLVMVKVHGTPCVVPPCSNKIWHCTKLQNSAQSGPIFVTSKFRTITTFKIFVKQNNDWYSYLQVLFETIFYLMTFLNMTMVQNFDAVLQQMLNHSVEFCVFQYLIKLFNFLCVHLCPPCKTFEPTCSKLLQHFYTV
jgi:hypothetical protein